LLPGDAGKKHLCSTDIPMYNKLNTCITQVTQQINLLI